MAVEFHQFDYNPENLIDDRYRPVRILGEGATGAVVLVEDTGMEDRKLALKLLLPHLVSNSDSLSRFRTETRITMSLSHPNILQTFGMGRHKSAFYYLKMEYCEGVSLRQLLADSGGGLPVSIAIGILRDVASALHYAHERGVIHRDLKPENIIIASDENAKLLDFGLAQTFLPDSRVTGAGAILGTPCYMSPEQLNAELLDRRCDIYSFGILAWEMLTGTRPFDGDTLLAIAEAHLKEELPPLSAESVPAWLNELIRSCTMKERVQRPDSMIEVFSILDNHSQRPASTFINRSLGDTRAGTSVMSLRRRINIWCRTNLGRLSGRLGMAIFLFALIIPPHVNSSMQWRYATGILWFEKRLGIGLHFVRIVLNTPPEIQYPESFFGPSERMKERYYSGHRNLAPRLHYRPLLHSGYSPNFIDKNWGMPPLYYYLQGGKVDATTEFLEQRADPNLVDLSGKRALDHAIESPYNSAQLVEKLLRAGADPNLFSEGVNAPLIRALKLQKLKVIDNLLQHGKADPNARDLGGQPALYLAIASGRYEIVRSLLRHGADPGVLDKSGKDPLAFSKSIPFLLEREKIEALLREHIPNETKP